MLNDRKNRVINRLRARELSPTEAQIVTGGQTTLTVCTIGSNGEPDGDVSLGECS
jgi:hypothetical protein